MVDPAPRRFRVGATAAGVGLLFWAVAVLAGDVPGDQPAGSILSLDREAVADWTVPMLRLAYVAALIAGLYAWLVGRQRRPGGGQRRRVPMIATFLALVLGAVLVLVVLPRFITEPEAVVATTTFVRTPAPDVTAPSVVAADGVTAPTVWWVPVVMALAGAVYLAARRRRLPTTSPAHGARPASGVTDVDGPGSPDRADPAGRVLVAYRQVEEVSARRGLGRAHAETAARHLRRLSEVVGGDATESLTSLFHRARYSGDTVGAEEATSAESESKRIVDGLDG